MYKGNRRKEVCRLFGRQKHVNTVTVARHRNQRQVFTLRSRYRGKTKNRLPPKNYRRIALPPKKYRHILVHRFRQSRYRRKMNNRLPPKNYRRTALPPKKYRHTWFYRFRQSRYRQKRENRQPPKKITAVWQYRPSCVRLKNRCRRPP